MSYRWLKAVLAAGLVFAMPAALASGFHIYEQGAKASGQAVAFIARADDASANWYNPAAITQFDSALISIGVSGVFLGDTQFESKMDRVNPFLFSGGTDDMVDNTGTPIHLYYVQPLGQRFALGVGVTTPFGLVSEWPKGSDVRFSARKSDLETVVANVNGAFEFGCGWSGAVGVDYLMADLKDFGRNVSLRTINPQLSDEPYVNLSGDGDDFGWNAAVHFKGESFFFGAMYRSGYSVGLEGDLEFSGVPAIPIGEGATLKDLFPNTPGSGTLELPAMYGAGIGWAPNRNWEFEFDVHAIQWSDFEELKVDLKKNTPALADLYLDEDWENTFSYRFGTSYAFGRDLGNEIRAGVYIEDSAIPTRTLRPSIPDGDRTGASIGYGYKGKNFSIDAYYMYIWIDDVSTSLSEFLNDNSVVWGTYKSSLSLLGVTAGFSF